MINFKNLVVIKTLHLDQGDLYFLDQSSANIKRLTEAESKKKKPNPEKIILSLLDAMLCDAKGKLLNLTREDFEEMPRSVFQEIALFCQSLAMGEKKS
jgi:hypothetical protein|tara:strand:- start:315 stop:608 length:294 start_codon:yes stop_codon:yes gene_type:complete